MADAGIQGRFFDVRPLPFTDGERPELRLESAGVETAWIVGLELRWQMDSDPNTKVLWFASHDCNVCGRELSLDELLAETHVMHTQHPADRHPCCANCGPIYAPETYAFYEPGTLDESSSRVR